MKKTILVLLTILLTLTCLNTVFAGFPIILNPKVNGVTQPSTSYDYEFKFVENNDCSGVLLSNESTVTTDASGVVYLDLDVSNLTTTPSYLCEYRSGSLRKTHSLLHTFIANNMTLGNALFVDSSTGKVGIGTTSPAAVLEVTNTTAITALLNISHGHGDDILINNTGIDFDSGTLFVDEVNNRVGIGTTAPDNVGLHIYKPSGSDDILKIEYPPATGRPALEIRNDEGSASLFLGGSAYASYGGPNSFNMFNSRSGLIAFTTNGQAVPQMVIDLTGDVGIGTMNPLKQIDIADAYPEMRFNDTDTYSYFDTGVVGTDFKIYSNGTSPNGITIDYSGNVGIGIATPDYPLHVAGNTSQDNGTISIFADRNVSATGYITRTSMWDKSKNVWDFVQDSSYYLDKGGEVDHEKFYGYAGVSISTDFDRPVEEEYLEKECDPECVNVTKTRTVYPYKKEEKGVMIDMELAALRQAVYELKQETILLKSELCKTGVHPWC